MSINLEHNGREISFDERDESWSCRAMSMKAKSLKALKTKIDKHDSVARRVSVPALTVHYGDRIEAGATIVMITKPKDRETDYSGSVRTPVPTVWINKTNGNQIERSKVRLDNCIAPTEENLLLIEAVKNKFAAARRMGEEAKAELAAIPRITLDDLAASGAVEDDSDEPS